MFRSNERVPAITIWQFVIGGEFEVQNPPMTMRVWGGRSAAMAEHGAHRQNIAGGCVNGNSRCDS